MVSCIDNQRRAKPDNIYGLSWMNEGRTTELDATMASNNVGDAGIYFNSQILLIPFVVHLSLRDACNTKGPKGTLE